MPNKETKNTYKRDCVVRSLFANPMVLDSVPLMATWAGVFLITDAVFFTSMYKLTVWQKESNKIWYLD